MMGNKPETKSTLNESKRKETTRERTSTRSSKDDPTKPKKLRMHR